MLNEAAKLSHQNWLKLQRELISGADKHLKSASRITANPHVAIGQLLLAAASLAVIVEMPKSQFLEGCNLAMNEAYKGDVS